MIVTLADIWGDGDHLSSCDMAIIVDYHWWVVPIRLRDTFRFVAKKQVNGRFYWYAQPLP
jgi:hypothetical protein